MSLAIKWNGQKCKEVPLNLYDCTVEVRYKFGHELKTKFSGYFNPLICVMSNIMSDSAAGFGRGGGDGVQIIYSITIKSVFEK